MITQLRIRFYFQDTIQFRPRRITKTPSLTKEAKSPSAFSFKRANSRKISKTMASCLKKNESFFDSPREFEHGREQVIPYKVEHQFAKGTIMVMATICH